MEIEPVLTVVQQADVIRCSDHASFALDGSETRYQVGRRAPQHRGQMGRRRRC